MLIIKPRQCENSKNAKYCNFRGNGAPLADPRTGRDRHDDGRRACACISARAICPRPEYIKQAANRALADGYTFYTENAGLPSLRRALADNYCRLHGVSLDPATEIVVTASGVQALNLGIRCVLESGR